MLTRQEFLTHLRQALNHLYEPDRLRQNPLAALFGIANRPDAFPAMQDILTEAIESLAPRSDEPRQSQAWELHELLSYRYLQQMTQQQVARQLGMSVRHLRRKEHAAIEALAGRLWRQFDLDSRLRDQADDTPAMTDELAWLKETPPAGAVDLPQTLSEVIQLSEPLAARYGVRLEATVSGDLPGLAIHPIALSQTLLNLLSVAIRQATGGCVFLLARAHPAEVELQIQTQSPAGSPPLSGDDAASLEQAQYLADLSGGRLTLPEEEGENFSATLTLPAAQQLPVLVIDDNADTLQLLQRYTAGTRYCLITTRDPDRALSLAEEFSPRIIVLDVMMPRVDGWKVLSQLRQHPRTGHIPVIVCTILAQEEMAFSLGASGFVRKPVTRQAFLAALDEQAARIRESR